MIAALCCVSLTCFADKQPLPEKRNFQPPTFKQEWEDFSSLLNNKISSLSMPNVDSSAIWLEIKTAITELESKWDIEAQMKTYTTSELVCILSCAWEFYNCQSLNDSHNPPGQIPHNCVAVYLGCLSVRCR